MSNNNQFRSSWHHKLDVIVTAFVFISIGLLLIARNLGIINYSVYHFLMSWQMLLIVIGVVQLIKQKIVAGAILITIGVWFLFPSLPWWPGKHIVTFWPAIFILTGVVILLSRLNRSKEGDSVFLGRHKKSVSSSKDGFIVSEVAFGSAQQIVFDPYFKGAQLCNSFGSTVLDLRRTQLQDQETYIDIECSFGGIEIYVPAGWNVIIQVENAVSGYHDKRYRSYDQLMDMDHKLIIRGKLAFSSMDIKS